MRLLYIAFPTSVHTLKWINHFKRDHDILLISFYSADKIEGIQQKCLPVINKNLAIIKLPEVKRIIRDFKPDILHAHYASSCGFIASLTGFHPYLLSVWGDDILDFPAKSPLHKWAVRRAIRSADYVTATSEMLGKSTRRLMNSGREVEVIPFGVDLNHYNFIKRPARDSIHIGSVRKLMPKYGLEYLIKAVAKLISSGNNVRLTIAGKGELKDRLQSMSRNLGISEYVHFTGFVENEKVVELLQQFDLFAMPSIKEGETFGVAAVEAMATGLPVVASRIGGLPEVIDHNSTGLLTEPKNVDSLAEAIKIYLDNPKLRETHGANARDKVERCYDWSRNALQIENLYKRVLRNNRSH